MSQTVWLKPGAGGGTSITLHIQPGASRSEFAGEHGDALKIRLAAPPVDGRANAALIAFLANFFSLPRASIQIAAGHSSRRKRIEINLAPEHIFERIQNTLKTSKKMETKKTGA